MDFTKDQLFLEPLLVAWLTDKTPSIPLEQVLYGLLSPEHRPQWVKVHTDSQGKAFIAGLGYFRTGVANNLINLCIDNHETECDAVVSQEQGAVVFDPIKTMQIHGITIHTGFTPLLHRFFECETFPLVQPSSQVKHYLTSIHDAFDSMRRLDPELYQWIKIATRAIQIYCADSPNSFATLSAHGTAFLNVDTDSELIFFIDDLAHQCGHIIFNAVTLEKSAFIAIDPHTPLQSLTKQPDETRNVYSAFHGLFTYTMITRILNHLMITGELTQLQHHHCLGRMAFYLAKFYIDIRNLDKPGLFCEQGMALYQLFAHVYEEMRRGYIDAIKEMNLKNQPYVFSYKRFIETNPITNSEPVGV